MIIDHTHASPNHSSRDGADISMIVLHATAGSFASALAELMRPDTTPVSAHYLIDRDGRISQLVDDSQAAWHAGKSAWRDLDSGEIQRCSIGIELVNKNDGRDPYPAAQVQAAHDLCAWLITIYAIPRINMVRHLDIAIPKGRKTDPAGFPWAAFVEALYAAPIMPLPVVQRYRVAGTPIFQRQDLTGPIVAFLAPGEVVQIDMLYDNGAGHLADGRGFIALSNVTGPL